MSLDYNSELVQSVITNVIKLKSHKWHKVSYQSKEDIEQEIRLKCWSALNLFDPERVDGSDIKAKLTKFLIVCVENRLKNWKRDSYLQLYPPCVKFKCPLFEKTSKKCAINFSNCNPFLKYIKTLQNKIKVQSMLSIEKDLVPDIMLAKETVSEDLVIADDLKHYLRNKIKERKPQLLWVFDMLADNFAKGVPIKLKIEVRNFVSELLVLLEA